MTCWGPTQTVRTRGGSATILTAPPLLSYPEARSRETAALMLPPPSIGNQRGGDGWPDWTSTSAPTHLIQRTYNADLQVPTGWPPGLEWRPSYGSVMRSQLPTPKPRFDPRSMLWLDFPSPIFLCSSRSGAPRQCLGAPVLPPKG